jgi:hypothetical protein
VPLSVQRSGAPPTGDGGRGNVDIDVNRYNSFNRTNISNKSWNHNAAHRGGVAYRDQNVARQYNRGGNAQASQAREQFRGRAESGRSELKGMDHSQLNDRVKDADRGARENLGGRGEAVVVRLVAETSGAATAARRAQGPR